MVTALGIKSGKDLPIRHMEAAITSFVSVR